MILYNINLHTLCQARKIIQVFNVDGMGKTMSTNMQQRVGSKDKDVPWYMTDVSTALEPETRKLFEEYSHIPKDEVEKHVSEMRDKAWDVWAYPCIGMFRFLDLSIAKTPHYSTILQRLKNGNNEIFLDLGCCFGQELRPLVADGAPSENLYATDLRGEFWDLGLELFNDKETLKSKFIAGDVFDSESGLKVLDGKVDIIFAGSFLHLFDWEEQVKVCIRLVTLLKPKPDSLVLGRQVGNVDPGVAESKGTSGKKVWRHNEETFRKMWDEVGEKTGTKWRVEVELIGIGEGISEERGAAMRGAMKDTMRWWMNEGTRRLQFAVFRE